MRTLIVFIVLLISLTTQSQTRPPTPFQGGIVIGKFLTDPIGFDEGQIYWNIPTKRYRQFNGTIWEDLQVTSGNVAPLNFQQVTEQGNTTDNPIIVQGATISNTTANLNVGSSAGSSNTGVINGTNIGTKAGKGATGSANITNVGASAGENSSGSSTTNLGVSAGQNNKGNFGTNIGRDAGKENEGHSVVNIGVSSGLRNKGDNVTNLGSLNGIDNTHNDVINIGRAASTTADNQVAFRTSEFSANLRFNLPSSDTEITYRNISGIPALLSDLTSSGNIYDTSGEIPQNTIRNISFRSSSILNFSSDDDSDEFKIGDGNFGSFFYLNYDDIQIANASFKLMSIGVNTALMEFRRGLNVKLNDTSGNSIIPTVGQVLGISTVDGDTASIGYIDIPSNKLSDVIINSATYTLNEADIVAMKPHFVDASQTDVTITIPEMSLTDLTYFNLIHEGTGKITILPSPGVNQVSYEFTESSLAVTLYSRINNVWNVWRGKVTTYAYVPPGLGPNNNAVSDPNGTESNASTGFTSDPLNRIDLTVENTDVNVGNYALKAVPNTDGSSSRFGIEFPVEIGETYTVTWDGKEGATSDVRLYGFNNLTGSQVLHSNSWASYSAIVTATATGTAEIEWHFIGGLTTHEFLLDNLQIVKN